MYIFIKRYRAIDTASKYIKYLRLILFIIKKMSY